MTGSAVAFMGSKDINVLRIDENKQKLFQKSLFQKN